MLRLKSTILVGLFVLALTHRANGDDTAIDNVSVPHSLNDQTIDAPLRLDLFRDFNLRPHVDRMYLSSVTMSRPPPSGSTITRYSGLQGLVVRQVNSRLKRLWAESLRTALENDILSDSDYRTKITEMSYSLSDFERGGRWWDRTWFESLPEESGGAPCQPTIIQIGQRLEVLRLGPLSLTNELQIKFDDSTLRFGGSPRAVGESEPLNGRGIDNYLPDGIEASPFSSGLDTNIRGLGPDYKLRVRPSVSIRPFADPSNFIKQVTIRADLTVFYGPQRSCAVKVVASLSYSPDNDDTSLTWSISM